MIVHNVNDGVVMETTYIAHGGAIARMILEAHRGDLKVHSEKDSGTTFSVQLPVAKEVSTLESDS